MPTSASKSFDGSGFLDQSARILMDFQIEDDKPEDAFGFREDEISF